MFDRDHDRLGFALARHDEVNVDQADLAPARSDLAPGRSDRAPARSDDAGMDELLREEAPRVRTWPGSRDGSAAAADPEEITRCQEID